MIQQPDPTAAEIAQATAVIRSQWSAAEAMARRERIPPLLSDCDFKAIEARAMAERQRLLAIGRNREV
jgi:hypothetical protein